jgi:site-specific recombinase XerD
MNATQLIEACERYLDSVDAPSGTRRKVRGSVAAFAAWLGNRPASKETLDLFGVTEATRGMKATTVQTRKSCVRVVLKFVAGETVENAAPPPVPAMWPEKPSPLLEAVEKYLLARPCSPQYARRLADQVRTFAKWVNGRAITSALLNEYLVLLEARNLAPETVRNYRTALLGVLKFSGWIPDSHIRTARVRQKAIDCFTLAEIRSLVEAAERLKGELPNGLSNAMFWSMAIHGGYSTGLRFSDMMGLPAASIADDGACRICQSKTGRLVVVRFSREAMALIRGHGREFAFPWPYSANEFRVRFGTLTVAAGVRQGCWKWLRRSAGSHAEMISPGRGHLLLGNTKDVFQGHYAAWSVIQPAPVEPPSIRRAPAWRRWVAAAVAFLIRV